MSHTNNHTAQTPAVITSTQCELRKTGNLLWKCLYGGASVHKITKIKPLTSAFKCGVIRSY